MKKGNMIVSGIVCASVLLCSGCVKLWQENLDIKTYMVEAERTASPLDNPLGRKLWIDPVVVLPPCNMRNLVLRSSDVEYRTSYYTELIIPPAENFRNAFFSWFSDTGIFDEVSLSEHSGATHQLIVTVTEFYGDTMKNEAVLNIRVSLLDEKSRERRVVISKNYGQRVALAGMEAEELIRAYNAGLAAILSECEQDVIGSFR
jgi:uncharacterized lipoprotein YmbA